MTSNMSEADGMLRSLRKSEKKYRLLSENMSSGFSLHKIITDKNGKAIDYQYLDINYAFEKLTGLKRENVIGKRVTEVMPGFENDTADWINKYAKVALEGASIQFEQYSEALGTWYSVSAYSPEKGKFVTLFHNITDRKNSEQELQESEQKFRFLAENSIDIIYTIDMNERYMYVSPSVEKILGYTVDEALSMKPKDILTPESYKRQCEGLQRALTKSSDYKTISEIAEFEVIRKDGSIIWGEINARFIVDDHGNPIGILGICRDINERKKLEEQLLLRQRMDSLGTLVGGIAHDFNNILVGIMGNIDLLKYSSKNFNDSQKTRLDSALRSCERAADLIRRFQALSKVSSTEKESMDLYEIVKEVFDLLDNTTDKIINKRIDFNSGNYFVYGNASELHQVFLNLGTNAVDAIEERGKKRGDFIKISAEECDAKTSSSIGLSDGKYIHIRFEDNGIGMSEDTIKKAFDPFFTTKEKGAKKGQGLGLAMVYNIITRIHNGHIYIESIKSKGTVFHIYLTKAEVKDQFVDEENIEYIGGSETVLLIDDEKLILEIEETILTELGYTVITAVDGERGLKKYKESQNLIDIVILDLMMPNMSGEMVLRKLLKINPDIKVIISSGHSEESIKDGILAKTQGIVKKPYKMRELAQCIRQVLDM